MKIKQLYIQDYKAFKGFELNLTDETGEALPLVVIAGINGSGKTTLLEFIKAEYASNAIIYLDVSRPNTTNIEQSIQNYIDDIVYNKGESARNAYESLREKLSSLFESFELTIAFKTLNKDKKVFFTNKRGEEIELSQLSTGEQALLSKLFYFYLADIRDSLILIDEPELSLHPKWQSHVVALYQQLAQEKNNQIILATHSPQVIASTPAESLFMLMWEEDKIVAKNANAYGMTVNDVLLKVMQVDSLRDPKIQAEYNRIKQQLLDGSYRQSSCFNDDFKALEALLENDPLEIGILRAEKLRQDKNHAAF
jgi:predicted ATP-binding protein involved in virulence